MYEHVSDPVKASDPDVLLQQAEALLSGQVDAVSNAANLAALLFHSLPDVNWVGFYFLKEGRLLVGPFQGLPACVEIPLGKGVCGTAAATREVQRVADVDAFDGHIACDAASRSEIVVPLMRRNELLGVLDIDSPVPDRFTREDQAMLERIAGIYVRSLEE
jgi:GAF domain-containing protein